ncbi:MAG: pyridoxal phosphate-dependent aminotransferase [Cyclobacteriaceae bacterium]|nr:pyridoxal phosphate-dependent aminotransferase [Cyclobacteriaceae bacterium]
MKLTARAKDIAPFIVMEVLEKAQEMESQGIDVIHLEVGEPDFDVPKSVIIASNIAMMNGQTHYTHSLGDPQLRQAISHDHKLKYGIDIDPSRIIITSGSSPAIHLILTVLMERGMEVIIPDPGYACYPNFIKLLEGIPVPVKCEEQDGFQYDPEKVKAHINENTEAIFLNSPSNPTGHIAGTENIRSLTALDKWIISDEIYHGLEYESKANSILEFTERAFVVNGFSKLYAMTGLRVGYVIAPAEYVRPIQKIQQNLFICASSVAQRAAIKALEACQQEVLERRDEYAKRRLLMIDRLKSMGFGIARPPEGAFYIFANARQFSHDSYRLAFDILEKAHVGVTPGIDFGANGEGFLRFSYANSIKNIEEAMNRLELYLKKTY